MRPNIPARWLAALLRLLPPEPGAFLLSWLPLEAALAVIEEERWRHAHALALSRAERRLAELHQRIAELEGRANG